jgi:hypothetical protein
MITGYNTDVRHNEVVFHVQTEDKGLANPFIESLVYVGGQVLARKSASYAELLASGKDEKDIVTLMDHQHRTMIAAIRHGKLDSRLADLLAGRQTGAHPKHPTALPTPMPSMLPLGTSPGISPETSPGMPPPPPPAPITVAPPAPEPEEFRSALPPLPPRSATRERTLDQVILEYLTNEADQEQLVLMIEEESNLSFGQQAALVLRASSSKSGAPVLGTQVSVRMISTVNEPRVLASGRADDQGQVSLAFEIPQVGRGTAALIITAVSSIGRAELKHLL